MVLLWQRRAVPGAGSEESVTHAGRRRRRSTSVPRTAATCHETCGLRRAQGSGPACDACDARAR